MGCRGRQHNTTKDEFFRYHGRPIGIANSLFWIPDLKFSPDFGFNTLMQKQFKILSI